jgi:hypothetical protein
MKKNDKKTQKNIKKQKTAMKISQTNREKTTITPIDKNDEKNGKTQT